MKKDTTELKVHKYTQSKKSLLMQAAKYATTAIELA